MLSPVFWTQDCCTNVHLVLWEHSDSVQSEILTRIRTLGLYTYHSRLPTQDLQQTYICIIHGSIATSHPLNYHVSGLYHVPFVVCQTDRCIGHNIAESDTIPCLILRHSPQNTTPYRPLVPSWSAEFLYTVLYRSSTFPRGYLLCTIQKKLQMRAGHMHPARSHYSMLPCAPPPLVATHQLFGWMIASHLSLKLLISWALIGLV